MYILTIIDKSYNRNACIFSCLDSPAVFSPTDSMYLLVLQRSELSRQGLLSAERYGEVLKTQVRGGGTPQESVVTGDSVITLRNHRKYKMLLLPLENRLWKPKDYNTVCFLLLLFALVFGKGSVTSQ